MSRPQTKFTASCDHPGCEWISTVKTTQTSADAALVMHKGRAHGKMRGNPFEIAKTKQAHLAPPDPKERKLDAQRMRRLAAKIARTTHPVQLAAIVEQDTLERSVAAEAKKASLQKYQADWVREKRLAVKAATAQPVGFAAETQRLKQLDYQKRWRTRRKAKTLAAAKANALAAASNGSTIEVMFNYCPKCGFHIQSAAVGIAYAQQHAGTKV